MFHLHTKILIQISNQKLEKKNQGAYLGGDLDRGYP